MEIGEHLAEVLQSVGFMVFIGFCLWFYNR